MSIDLPQSRSDLGMSDPSNTKFHPDPNALFSLQDPKEIQILWTPEAVYRVLKSQDQEGIWQVEIEIQMLVDGSVWTTCPDFEFITLITNEEPFGEGQFYCIKKAPEYARNAESGQAYRLSEILKNSLKLYQNTHSCLARRMEHQVPQSSLRSAIVKQAIVDSLGTFVYYQDGRIHIVFNDRTHLCWNMQSSRLKIMNAQGEQVILRAESAIGYEKYMYYAKLFRNWVLGASNPQEKEFAHRAMARSREFAKSLT